MDHQKAYIQFEEAFRGPRHEILHRLSSYNDFLFKLKGESPSKSLDLGCGRGEWLELCKKIGFSAQGVDFNSYFVEQCNNLGLNAKCANIIELLPLLGTSSYALVSAFHLIEHLESNDLLKLLPEILRILEPGGFVLLETPSIDNFIVATKSFYIDPTHINPIHPEALCFFLKECGFAWAKVFYINGSTDKNNSCNHITRTFMGVAQDVCILASKGIPNKVMLAYLESGSIFNYAPTTLEAFNLYEQYKSQAEQGNLYKIIQAEQSIALLKADFQGLINLINLYRKLKRILLEPKIGLLTMKILKKLKVYTFFKIFYFKFISKINSEQLPPPTSRSITDSNIPEYMKSQLNKRALEILNDLNNPHADTDSRKS